MGQVYHPYHPWDWYIYLHLVAFNGKIMVNVGKYTVRPMDAMGHHPKTQGAHDSHPKLGPDIDSLLL